jgi:tetratricopeptide (TPR) repeat protein
MGVFYESLGKSNEALQSYQNALAMRRKFMATETLLSESLENLGTFLLLQGQRDESKSLLEESLAIRVKYFGLDSIPVAESLVSLARWWKQGDELKSLRLANEALMIFQKSNGVDAVTAIRQEFDLPF